MNSRDFVGCCVVSCVFVEIIVINRGCFVLTMLCVHTFDCDDLPLGFRDIAFYVEM